MSDYEFIVLGAGAAGASAAYQLARRGRRVLLLERFAVGHDRGASQGHSRIFRFAYTEAEYARFAMHAFQAWRALEADAGETLLTMTGGLDLGPADSATLQATMQGLTAAGARFDRLDATALMQRFPQWRVPDDWLGLHSPDAGILPPTHCIEVIVGMARAHGATVLEWTQALEVQSQAGEVHVKTDRGVFSAAKVIVAAGAWLPELFPGVRLPLQVTLESGVFFRPHTLEAFRPERFPIFIAHVAAAPGSSRWAQAQPYGFPVFGLPGVKVGLHQSGETVSAASRGFDVPEATIRAIQAWLEAHLPDAAGPVMHAKTCLYTNTPGHDFLVDWATNFEGSGAENVLIASPCSGHGFKFAPAIGELLADLVMDQPNEFAFNRFKANRALVPA